MWTSYANTSRVPSVPDFAQVAYDDSAWARVDAPHDFILAGNDSAVAPYTPTANQGQAFIPKSVGAYRKHFRVPAEWAGSHIELYIEGLYASATYYLNGAPLGYHGLGYTSASLRLDNATGGLFFDGRENILAVYVDATEAQCTGWWYVLASCCARGGERTSPPPPRATASRSSCAARVLAGTRCGPRRAASPRLGSRRSFFHPRRFFPTAHRAAAFSARLSSPPPIRERTSFPTGFSARPP
jgi:hypothetical protein